MHKKYLRLRRCRTLMRTTYKSARYALAYDIASIADAGYIFGVDVKREVLAAYDAMRARHYPMARMWAAAAFAKVYPHL